REAATRRLCAAERESRTRRWATMIAPGTRRVRAPLRKSFASRLHDPLKINRAPNYLLERRSPRKNARTRAAKMDNGAPIPLAHDVCPLPTAPAGAPREEGPGQTPDPRDLQEPPGRIHVRRTALRFRSHGRVRTTVRLVRHPARVQRGRGAFAGGSSSKSPGPRMPARRGDGRRAATPAGDPAPHG